MATIKVFDPTLKRNAAGGNTVGRPSLDEGNQ